MSFLFSQVQSRHHSLLLLLLFLLLYLRYSTHLCWANRWNSRHYTRYVCIRSVYFRQAYVMTMRVSLMVYCSGYIGTDAVKQCVEGRNSSNYGYKSQKYSLKWFSCGATFTNITATCIALAPSLLLTARCICCRWHRLVCNCTVIIHVLVAGDQHDGSLAFPSDYFLL